MKLTFLGTRAYIDVCAPEHRRHSAALLERDGARVMIDCGEDWVEKVHNIAPDAIVLTHAHPDHAFGLKNGAPCSVYATEAAWETIDGFPIGNRRAVRAREPLTVRGIEFEAFEVAHSTRCPAVGYRIHGGRGAPIFYVPDVAYIPEHDAALDGVRVYVGDGSSLERSLIRRHGDNLLGHAPVRQQLTWCRKAGVPEAVFTHCGRDRVTGDPSETAERLRALATERGVSARYAEDGLELELA